ncbi:beta strand repeat-containing protein [Haloplanus sp. C73]|uniref:beta strand repeat-containing protein n=1 Tax=Haloplanus sp. C73 TaxID=3421641 RepID=UPI003EBD01E0
MGIELVTVLVATVVVLGSLGSPLVMPAAAATENVSVQDGNGNVIDTASAGQTVYIQANVSDVNGTTETAVVSNESGGEINVEVQDNDSDGEYRGSFTVSASSTSDTDDRLRLKDNETATVSVDLDGQGDNGTATVTADYGPSPTAATTLDTDENGTVDAVNVTFDEQVNGSVAYSTGDFTVDNATVSGIASNDGDDTLRLELGSAPVNDTGVTPDVTVAQNAVQDTNGNAGPAGSSETVTASDGAAPIALNASYRDANADGTVDRVDVRYSEDVSASSYADGDWSILQSGSVDIAKDNSGTISTDEVRIDVTGAANTTGGATSPEVDYAGTSVTDGQNAAPAQTLTVEDGAAPTFDGVTTIDANQDGTVDNLTVTFTEAVASGSVDAGDFSIGTADGLSGTVSGVTGDDGDATVNVTLDHGALGKQADTGANPTLAYASGTGGVQDAAGNQMADVTSDPATDGAAPYPVQITMTDGPTPDGTVDSIGVLYSENVSASSPEVGDYSLGGSDADAVTIDKASITDQASLNDSAVVLNVTAPANDTGLNLTLSYDASAGTSGSITDGSNPAISVSDLSVTDKASPLMQSVTTESLGGGTVDLLQVVFTEPVDDSSVDTGDFSLSTGQVDSVLKSLSVDNQTTLEVSGFPNDTSVTPDVTVADGGVYGASGDSEGSPKQTLTASDGAPPDIIAATTADGNDDGTVDRIDLTVSEPLDDSASTLDASAFSLSSGSVDSVDTGTADDDSLQLTVSGLSGSDATPDVTVADGTLVDPLGNANLESTFTGTTSGAAPAVESVTTLDRDGDGDVDAANVTFSGAIDDSTVSAGDWTIGGTTVDSVDTLSAADDDRVQLRLTGTGVSGTGTAEVTYTPGSTADDSGNLVAAVDAGDVSEADGATPVVTNVSVTTIDGPTRVQVEVTATESLGDVSVDLSGPESATLSSFAVSGNGPYVHTLTYDPSSEGRYTATLQTAADDAGNDGASGQQNSTRVSFSDGGGGSAAPSAPGSLTSRVSSETVTVFGGTGGVTFDLGSGSVSRVEVSSDASGTGFARATTLDSPPEGVSAPDDRTVGVVSIQMPDDWATTPATLRMSVDASATDVDPERLQVVHYDESTDSWDILDTSVDSQSGTTTVLSAEAPGFSTFAVVETEPSASTTVEVTTATPDGSDEPATTEDDAATPAEDDSAAAGTTAAAEPAGTTTTGDGAGFGALAGLVGLVTLLALARRRQ